MTRIWLWLWLLIPLQAGAAQSPDGLQDLGVLSPSTLIPLSRNTSREDFHHFEIEVCSSLETNRVVKFSTTNEFLDLTNLTALPSGRMLLGVKSVSSTGQESAVHVSTFTIWRADKMPTPSAGTVVLRTHFHTNRIGEGSDSLMRAFGRLRVSSTQPVAVPPLPPGMTTAPTPKPLPGGKSETYGDYLDAQAEKKMRHYYANTGRRNE